MTLSQIYGQVFVQASYTFSSLFGTFLVIMTSWKVLETVLRQVKRSVSMQGYLQPFILRLGNQALNSKMAFRVISTMIISFTLVLLPKKRSF